MHRILSIAAAVVALLVVVVLANTLRFRSRQPAVAPAPPLALDADVAQHLAAAIRFRTVSHQDPADDDRAAFVAFHRWLAETFPRAHAKLAPETVADASLLFTWKGRAADAAPVLLLAHQDVVPVDPATETAWTHPPFAGEIADGFVWGRGALDDKASLVGLLEAVERLLAEGFEPRRTVYLAFGHDEEVGGAHGATTLAARLGEHGVVPLVVLDEGLAVTEGIVPDVASPVALVGIAEKGYVSVELVVQAEGGHSSTPPHETAVGILAAALERLERRQMPARIAGPVRRLFEAIGPEMSLRSRVALANPWLFAPLVTRALEASPETNALVRTTTAPTIVEAGIKENVLPARARAVVNFRVLPGDSTAEVLAHVTAVVADSRVAVTLFRTTLSEPSPESRVDSVGFAAIARTIRELFPGAVVAPSLVLGATDARHYASLGADVYRFLPLRVRAADLRRVHGIDERVAVDDWTNAVRFYARLIRNLDAP
jgi:carboxypeptidase PM20D1